MKDCLIVFAKEPVLGRVKTRIEKHLSKNKCLNLYKAFFKDTVEFVAGMKGVEKILAYDSNGAEPMFLKKAAQGFVFYEQEGNTLGDKMNNAFIFAKKLDFKKVVIIGSDSPNLPVRLIKDAFRHLNEHDIVLGPSVDGGFYLIGSNEPCSDVINNVRWSTEKTLEDTIRNVKKFSKKFKLLDDWYDVDDLKGLDKIRDDYKKDRKSTSWTKIFLKI